MTDREASQAERNSASDDASIEWRLFLDKTAQSSLLLVLTKLVAAWVCAWAWSVPMQSRFIWGFIPFAGLQTTAVQFRTLAAWSTAITAAVAIIWALAHFLPNRTSRGRLWGAYAALPMAILLTLFEWWRRFDGSHLLPEGWLMRIVIAVLVPAVLILGFAEEEVREPADQGDRRPDAETTHDDAASAELVLTH